MARKSIESWLLDLREGTPNKRAAAARALSKLDVHRARQTLLELLAETPASAADARRSLGRCLHWVADPAAARLIAADPDIVLDTRLLPTSACAALYDDLSAELPSVTSRRVLARLAALRILKADLDEAHGKVDDETTWREALAQCLVAVLNDNRLGTVHAEVGNVIARLASPVGDRALLERFQRQPEGVEGLDVHVAWLRGRLHERGDDDSRAKLAVMTEALAAKKGAGAARLDALLALTVDELPEAFLLPVARSGRRRHMPDVADAVARRVVGRAFEMHELISIVDDETLTKCWPRAYLALVEIAHAGPREVIQRSARAPREVLHTAFAKVSSAELYDLMAEQVEAAPSLLYVIPTLRDPRWLGVKVGSEPMTRALLSHIARDLENASGDVAVERLVAQLNEAGDVVHRRAVLTALGDTGRPSAAPPLLAAFADPTIGSAMEVTLRGIGRCAGPDAIPLLESKIGGRWKDRIESAIEAIRGR